MTAKTMTMETKATAATCCCLRRRRQRHAIAKLAAAVKLAAAYALPPPTRCRRAFAAAVAFGRTAGDNNEGSGRRNQ
jgi:hypothetical protein